MKVSVVGAGGHAKVVAGTAVACGHELLRFVDDDAARWSRRLFDVEVTGPLEAILRAESGSFAAGIGDNETRRRLAERFARLEWVRLVHPWSWVHPSVTVGHGTVAFAGVVVQPDTRIGAHAIINTSASVDHDCVVGDYVHLAPGVHLAGHVTVGTGAFVGIGAVVIPRVTIGEWAVVGAGAVVTQDVPAHATVAGVPARRIHSQRS